MLALLLSFVSYANPLSCKDIQEMESQEKPLFEIQRSIQQNGMQEGVRACLEKKSLSRLIPNPDQGRIAPNLYTVRFVTTKGDFLARFERAWAPTGNDRFYTLVHSGFYQDIAFFRAIRGFMLQFGIHGDPIQTQTWSSKPISDDTPQMSNTRGYITFAMAGPNSRTTQLFINTNNNANLDAMGFAPIGFVVDIPDHKGMQIVDNIFTGYGEGYPSGRGPSQELLQTVGNAFLREHYPYLDYIKRIELCENRQSRSLAECAPASN